MKQNKIAFVVPTWPPHFWRAYNLLKSFKKYKFNKQADLFFVFTSEEEKKKFKYSCNNIILPQELRIFKNKGIINIKKFYALNQIRDKYDYIIVLDDESKFVKNINLYSMCEEYYKNKLLYANHAITDVSEILDACKMFFSAEAQRIISKHDSEYLWFNQLCIYKTGLLEDFFEKTGILNKLSELKYVDFDYMIFMFYLIAIHKWKVKMLPVWTNFGMLENSVFVAGPQFWETEQATFKPYHCNKNLTKLINTEKVFCYIQLNVGEGEKKPSHFKLLRRILACLIPSRELRRKIRG